MQPSNLSTLVDGQEGRCRLCRNPIWWQFDPPTDEEPNDPPQYGWWRNDYGHNLCGATEDAFHLPEPLTIGELVAEVAMRINEQAAQAVAILTGPAVDPVGARDAAERALGGYAARTVLDQANLLSGPTSDPSVLRRALETLGVARTAAVALSVPSARVDGLCAVREAIFALAERGA